MKNLRIPVLFLFTAIVSMAGCSSNSTSVNTPPPVIPAIGSSFITIDNNSDTVYDTVVTTTLPDTAHHGCTSVEISITNGQNFGNNPFYESFLSDGDLALEGTSSGWGASGVFEVLPFASHATVIDTFTQNDGSTTYRDSVAAVYSGAGKPFVLDGQTYQTDSVTVTAFYIGLGPGVSSSQYGYSFMPAIGLIAYYNNGSKVQWTTSYSHK
jgi:hypothetical protein